MGHTGCIRKEASRGATPGSTIPKTTSQYDCERRVLTQAASIGREDMPTTGHSSNESQPIASNPRSKTSTPALSGRVRWILEAAPVGKTEADGSCPISSRSRRFRENRALRRLDPGWNLTTSDLRESQTTLSANAAILSSKRDTRCRSEIATVCQARPLEKSTTTAASKSDRPTRMGSSPDRSKSRDRSR